MLVFLFWPVPVTVTWLISDYRSSGHQFWPLDCSLCWRDTLSCERLIATLGWMNLLLTDLVHILRNLLVTTSTNRRKQYRKSLGRKEEAKEGNQWSESSSTRADRLGARAHSSPLSNWATILRATPFFYCKLAIVRLVFSFFPSSRFLRWCLVTTYLCDIDSHLIGSLSLCQSSCVAVESPVSKSPINHCRSWQRFPAAAGTPFNETAHCTIIFCEKVLCIFGYCNAASFFFRSMLQFINICVLNS